MRLLKLARFLAQWPRAPIEIAQAVEYRTLNPVFCVRLEFHILPGIELVKRFHKAQNAGLYEVVKRDVRWQSVVNPPRDIADLG
jgi:hypothetical protein